MYFWNILATVCFLFALAALILRWLAEAGLPLPSPWSDPLPRRRGELPGRKELTAVFLLALLFRVSVAVGSLSLYNVLRGGEIGVGELPGLWLRWDAPHYVKLAELGYGGYLEEGKPLFLVFFPLYVWIIRGLTPLAGNTALAGMMVSFLCFAWGSVYLYRLGSEEYGCERSRRALALCWTFPFSFFFGGVMTESLFLLTTAAALYHVRRHQWGGFALWGILAAMTRMQGVILIGAAVAELFHSVEPFRFAGEGRARRWLTGILRPLPLLCAPALGSLVYLALNWRIAGNAFAFTEMQEHWSQGFQWFPSVLTYLLRNAVTWPEVSTRWEMWIPELVLFPVFAALLCRSWKKHRSMLTLYAFVYFTLTYCLSWLLSAGRYLSCGTPLFLFAADELDGKPVRTLALAVGMLVLQGIFCYRYLCWGQVM